MTMNYKVAWRPEPGLDNYEDSRPWDCLAMKIDGRKANESRGQCLTAGEPYRRDLDWCWGHPPPWVPDGISLSEWNERRAAVRALDWTEGGTYAPAPASTLRERAISGDIYFIEGVSGFIKIGFTTNLPVRLKALNNGSPVPVRVLALTPGSPFDERLYHMQFAQHRLQGEWFRRTPEIEAEISRLNPTLDMEARNG